MTIDFGALGMIAGGGGWIFVAFGSCANFITVSLGNLTKKIR